MPTMYTANTMGTIETPIRGKLTNGQIYYFPQSEEGEENSSFSETES
tara:strand:- start:209 stop:349 length:141 start_codon:yes stop_codon:yes gene_type:complete